MRGPPGLTTVDVDTDEDGAMDAVGSYEFTNCRVSRYTLTNSATGTTNVSTYTYDSAGNLIARDDETGRVYTWTYDCW